MYNHNGWLLVSYEHVVEVAAAIGMCPLELYFHIQNAATPYI